MNPFLDLGLEVEAAWAAANYDEVIFPQLCTDALAGFDSRSKVSPTEILAAAIREYELPRQRDLAGNFGDPPLTVFSGLRFNIDVYFWFEGTTSIHQHAFCGAFQVIEGSSIHSRYGFEPSDKINAFCEIGKLELRSCELLEAGSIKPIVGGRQHIHSLFHLDHPSVTLLIRTDRSPLELPQFRYFKPGLAVDPFFEQDTIAKKLQLGAALIRSNAHNADETIRQWLGKCDLQTSFAVLSMVRLHLDQTRLGSMFGVADDARFAGHLQTVTDRFPKHAVLLAAVFERQSIERFLVRSRAGLTEPEHRLFLALLMNIDGREAIFELIRTRYPDTDPLDKVLDWIYEIGITRFAGTDGVNALGIADFCDNDLLLLENMLTGAAVPHDTASDDRVYLLGQSPIIKLLLN